MQTAELKARWEKRLWTAFMRAWIVLLAAALASLGTLEAKADEFEGGGAGSQGLIYTNSAGSSTYSTQLPSGFTGTNPLPNFGTGSTNVPTITNSTNGFQVTSLPYTIPFGDPTGSYEWITTRSFKLKGGEGSTTVPLTLTDTATLSVTNASATLTFTAEILLTGSTSPLSPVATVSSANPLTSTSLAPIAQTLPGTAGHSYTIANTATGMVEVIANLKVKSISSGGSVSVDPKISVSTAIPEPATISLFCLGLLGLPALLWRRRKQAA